MGNICAFLNPQPAKKRPAKPPPESGHRWARFRSPSRKECTLEEQAIAAAILLREHQRSGGSLPFDRSASLNRRNSGPEKNGLLRSSSSRPRSLADPILQPHQLVNQDLKLEELESRHFVLVHGGGFGAWCWYKTIALLEAAGFKATAIDLTGSGIHSFDANGITSLSQYVKPLTDFLDKLEDGEKVMLVGHDFGGACISYAMEAFPRKVVKAVFVAATMLNDGQSTLDVISQQAGSNDLNLMQQAQVFLYANGNYQPPTAIDLDKSLFKELLFNQSPAKDIALASVSMRSIPFAPVLQKLSLSEANYGSVRRFYVETTEDNAIPLTVQESMVSSSSPEKVFRLRGADHSPFFSKPQALHKLLVEISSTQQPCIVS